ncbi:MAG: hypothetical protein ACLSAP_01310 [Oscillospiraceae bacterium]
MELLDLNIAKNPVEAADLLIERMAGCACLVGILYRGRRRSANRRFSQEGRPANAGGHNRHLNHLPPARPAVWNGGSLLVSKRLRPYGRIPTGRRLL